LAQRRRDGYKRFSARLDAGFAQVI